MLVFDADEFLCALDPVPLCPAGDEIRVEHFSPPLSDVEAKRHLGRLVFLEICAFVVDNFEQVQAVIFAFARSRALLLKGAQEVAERAEIMHRIGIENVEVAPQSSAIPGHFVVSGVWQYSERNLAALHEVLAELRAVYQNRPIGTDPKGAASAVRRLIGRWKNLRHVDAPSS